MRMLTLGRTACIAGAVQLMCVAFAAADMPPPAAATLVQSLIDAERKFAQIRALRVRTSAHVHSTERQLTRQKAARGGEPVQDWHLESELVFDSSRVRTQYDDNAHSSTSVWNGPERKSRLLNRQDGSEVYRLAATMLQGFEHNLYWISLSAPRFWFSPLTRPDPFAARPADYQHAGVEEIDGTNCYRLDCARGLRRVFVAVDDGRLRRIVQLSPPEAAVELALQSRVAGREFASLDDAQAYVDGLTDADSKTFHERCASARFALRLPHDETDLVEFRESTPGVWIPHKMTSRHYEYDGDECFLARTTATNVVEFQTAPELTERLFEVDIPEGAQIWDERPGIWPPMQYKYKSTFTDDEWQAIVSPQEKQLSAARKENETRELRIGQQVPEFAAATWLNSEPLSWEKLRGKIVILEFTADWCGNCLRHIPTLANLNDEKEGTPIRVVAIHAAGSPPDTVRKFVRRAGINYPLYVDVDEAEGLGKLYRWLQIDSIPRTILIDAQGVVAATGNLEDMLLKARSLSSGPAE